MADLQVGEGNPRTLAYGSSTRQDLRLLEVSEELLQELQDNGLTFKGNEHEEAVLCSETQTFAVKNVETSNLVLLLDTNTAHDSSGAPLTVSAIATSHLEVVNVGPRLHNLDKILAENAIDEDTINTPVLGSTWHDVLQKVQASPAELKQALIDRGAVCIQNQWRVIDTEYLGTILDVLLLTIIEHGWSVHDVPAVDASTALQQHSIAPELTVHCLKFFSRRENENKMNEEEEEEDSKESYNLNEKRVCRFLGIRLLQQQTTWTNADEFMDAWKKIVPEGMVPDMHMLRGQFIYSENSTTNNNATTTNSNNNLPKLIAFPEEALSQDPAQRFASLFAHQPKWLADDIIPYIEKLPGPGESVESLLLKYARASQVYSTDPVVYSIR